jgi:uncharacterized membrane protein HdeD (DUF308 family)
MIDNGSAGTTSSPEPNVVGSSPNPVVQQNVATPTSTSVRAPDLSTRAKTAAFDVAREARPWRENQSWWIVGIEGLLVLLVGLFVALQPENAAGIVRQLIAFVLLIVSVGRIIEGFKFRTSPAAPWATLRGGVGITVAALTLLSPLSQYIQGDGSRQILGLGLLAYGILGVIGALAVSGDRRYQWGALGGDVLAIVLGFLTLTRDAGEMVSGRLITGVFIVGGVALLVLAFMVRNQAASEA